MTHVEEQQRLARLKPFLERRAAIYQYIRGFFGERGFLEVETPIRTPAVAPEQHIVPLQSEGWFLSTSPELYMKRLLASGYERLFQISRCFRKGERGHQHNPEFTLLEWYRAGAGYEQMLRDTEELVFTIAQRLGIGSAVCYRNRIDLSPPWHRLTVREAFLGWAGWDPVAELDPIRFDIDLVNRVIPSLDPQHPTILLDYPAPLASLARLKPGDPGVAERAEVFIGGLEVANAYSELTDPREQERRFREEAARIEGEGRRAILPERFLKAMEHLPECGGIALGLDRLVMLFCNTDTIDDVLPFTSDTA